MDKKYKIIPFIVIIILFIILLLVKLNNSNNINISDINSKLSNYEYVILLYSDKTNENDELLSSFSQYNDIKTYYLNDSKDNINKYLSDYDLEIDDNNFLLIRNNIPVYIMDYNISYNTYLKYINKYFFDILPDDEIKFTSPTDASEYLAKVKSKKYSVIVFGKSTCDYCTKFKNTINEIEIKYNLGIYYIEKDTYDSDEYSKIVSLDFDIPAKCTTKNVDTTLSKITATPTTIITKSGKFVDCYLGYASVNDFEKFLSDNNVISEDD